MKLCSIVYIPAPWILRRQPRTVPLASDMITPTDRQRTVIRASSDWHTYQRNRDIYGLSCLGCGAQDAPHVPESTDLDATAGL